MTDDEQERRLGVALALRQIADRICDNPDWPVPDYPELSHTVGENLPAVDNAARAFDVDPTWNTGRTHYGVEAFVGPVRCRVVAITDAHMDEYYAAQKVAREWTEQQREVAS